MVCYKTFVTDEAERIGSDKCTLALDWNVWCCYEHDLSCHFAKDPRDAYRLHRGGVADYWGQAKAHPRREADQRFWRCNRKAVPKTMGRLKRWGWMLRSDVRYLGVRIGAIT